jgi:hypothetical protein
MLAYGMVAYEWGYHELAATTVVAEKYGIAELKEMAKAKFQGRAGSLLSAKESPEIIRELYRSTPSSDGGLCDIVSQVYA